MILWCDGGHAARENMRRDASLLARLEAADDAGGEAVLRLFRFDPPGITLGRAQSPERTLDLARCAADGVEWAVRPTGGRAIFHAEEWTYSLAARIADPAWGGSLADAYANVSRLVHASLVSLGIPARLVAGRARRAGEPVDPGAAEPTTDPARPSCFASTARHEIELDGRKLVGSAQRRTARALLQQGSVLLGHGHLRLADYLRVEGDDRERALRSLEANANPGGDHLGAARDLSRWADAIAGLPGLRVRRYSQADGAWLLTPGEAAPYTSAPHN